MITLLVRSTLTIKSAKYLEQNKPAKPYLTIAELLEEDDKCDKIRSLPLYSYRIYWLEICMYVPNVMIRSIRITCYYKGLDFDKLYILDNLLFNTNDCKVYTGGSCCRSYTIDYSADNNN